MKALISACLLGKRVRYDGGSNPVQALIDMEMEWIPVCPEVMGGLPTPRSPSERIGDRVMSVEGEDVTNAFQLGVTEALKHLEGNEIAFAILKSRSPSCGLGWIYDGSFSSKLVQGDGLLAEALREKSIIIFTEDELDDLFNNIDQLLIK